MKRLLSVLLLIVLLVSFVFGAMTPGVEARSTNQCVWTCIDMGWYVCCYYNYQGSITKDCFWAGACRVD